MLRCRDGVTAGGIHHHDTLLACRININIIKSYPGPSYYFEIVRFIYQFPGNLGSAPYGKSLVIFYYFFKLIRCEICHDINLNPRSIFKYFYSFPGQGVTYKNFLHFMSFSYFKTHFIY